MVKQRWWGGTKSAIALALVVVGIISLLPRPVQADPATAWYDSNWKYRKRITIDYTKTSGITNFTNFPVLINLSSDADLAADARDDGYDILFTSSDGTTKLDHEIESFNGTGNGALVAWVRMPTLSVTSNTTLNMYYGNSGASNQQNATGVWDSNFAGVWHLKETSGTVIGDSTSNANTGTPTDDGEGNPTVTLDTAGQINGADGFDGDLSSHINVSDNSSLDLPTTGTLEAWINSYAFIVDDGIIHKGDSEDFSDEAYSLQMSGVSNKVFLGIWSSSSNQSLEGLAVLEQLTWYHIAGAWDASGMYLYVNGVLDNSTTQTLTVRNTTGGINIGTQVDLDTPLPFDGIIDEVRISSVARSADWIKTSYNNQSSPGTFYRVGIEQRPGTWDSYQDSSHATQQDTFSDITTQHIAYMYGTNFTASYAYRVVYWNQVSGTWYNRQTVDVTATSGGALGDSSNLVQHTFGGADTSGDWHATVYESQSYSPSTYNANDAYIVADDNSYNEEYAFHVDTSAIPEFPGVLSAIGVAGLCAAVYWRFRRRRLAYVKV